MSKRIELLDSNGEWTDAANYQQWEEERLRCEAEHRAAGTKVLIIGTGDETETYRLSELVGYPGYWVANDPCSPTPYLIWQETTGEDRRVRTINQAVTECYVKENHGNR